MLTIENKACDITKLKVDAIVNAANAALAGGGGVDGAIHRAAGPELNIACARIGGCKTGQAVMTEGFNLPARYIIHTVGPIYGYDSEPEKLLADCYINSLNLAKEKGLKTLAFSAISTGVYGFPKQKAARIALKAMEDWARNNPESDVKIILANLDRENFEIYRDLLEQ